MITDWLESAIRENWPWLVLFWVGLRALSWWMQAVAVTNLSRRLDRYERDETLVLKRDAEARERSASLFRLLAEIDAKLSRLDAALAPSKEKDQQAEGKRLLKAESNS